MALARAGSIDDARESYGLLNRRYELGLIECSSRYPGSWQLTIHGESSWVATDRHDAMKELSKTREPGSLEELRNGLLRERPGFREQRDASAPKRAIGTALVRMRKQAGYSQVQVAEKAGWDKAFVSRLEGAGGAVPDMATLSRYAQACGQAVGLVFATIEPHHAHVVDAVTLAAPSSANPFESLRGENFALQEFSKETAR